MEVMSEHISGLRIHFAANGEDGASKAAVPLIKRRGFFRLDNLWKLIGVWIS